MELDLLLGLEGRFLGIEIKARQKLFGNDLRAMKAVASALGKDWAFGMIIYQGNEIKKLSDPSIWAVPSRRLFTRIS